MTETHNTWPDNSEKNNLSPEQKKASVEKKDAFRCIAKAEDAKNKETKQAIDEAKRNRCELQNETRNTVSENQSPNPPSGTFPQWEKEEQIEPSGMTLKYENSFKWCIIGAWWTAMSVINTSVDICKWVASTPKDLYDLAMWNATCDSFDYV